MSGGYSNLLLGLFYYAIDLKRRRWWAQPFVWVGANALTIYLIAGFVPLDYLARRFVGGNIEALLGRYGDTAVAAVALGLIVVFAWALYRKRIFIRL